MNWTRWRVVLDFISAFFEFAHSEVTVINFTTTIKPIKLPKSVRNIYVAREKWNYLFRLLSTVNEEKTVKLQPRLAADDNAEM